MENIVFYGFFFVTKVGFIFLYDTVSNAFDQEFKPLLKQLFNAFFPLLCCSEIKNPSSFY